MSVHTYHRHKYQWSEEGQEQFRTLGDLEKNPIQHLRLLLDTTTFLKNYLAVEKPTKKGRKKWVHQCLLVREREEWEEIHITAAMSLGAEY